MISTATRVRLVSIAHSGLHPTAWWAAHFRTNSWKEWHIPWTENPPLSAAELRRIAGSIAEFQRGESSEAQNYLARSAAFAATVREPSFHEASVLFVGEENEHAALLLRFMNLAGIARKQTTFSDGIFRRIRAVSDIGWSSRVLIIAELVAQEYYPCLRVTTRHPVLRRVCDKLIYDEFAHIRFQVERIAGAESGRGGAVRRLREAAQTILTLGAALVVYREHRQVLASLGCLGFTARILRRNRRVITAVRRLHAGLFCDASIVGGLLGRSPS
ncbi:MAG TPA: hypothetical protein VK985_16700 [Rariglobus sp.]|nr:hypothetical protein [Rariglobus sp.]